MTEKEAFLAQKKALWHLDIAIRDLMRDRKPNVEQLTDALDHLITVRIDEALTRLQEGGYIPT
jgi:hypothetical protein